MLKDVTKKSYEKPCLEVVSVMTSNIIALSGVENLQSNIPTKSFNEIKY